MSSHPLSCHSRARILDCSKATGIFLVVASEPAGDEAPAWPQMEARHQGADYAVRGLAILIPVFDLSEESENEG